MDEAFAALGYRESVSLVESFGIETPNQAIVADREQLDAATSGRLEYPLALKAITKDASHKTERQLVVTGLRTQEEVLDAFDKMTRRAIGMDVECFVLQEMKRGIEFIVGGKTDEVFGQTVLFGMGGVYVELTSDFAIRVCPIDLDTAYGMLSETKARAFFSKNGFRGLKASRQHVGELLVRTSELLEKNPKIVEMDLNPVIATDEKCYAVDVRALRRSD